MSNPHIPNGFKPLIEGYNIAAPSGVRNTAVAGGVSRSAMEFDRGPQLFTVAMNLSPQKFGVWSVFFLKLIGKGAYSFYMPIDSGEGLMDHLCTIVAGSYSAQRAGISQFTRISFVVEAESPIFDYSMEDAQALIDLWNNSGEMSDPLLRRIAQFANVDTTVLDF